jgi:cell wall-associated NlpC family hydrolase
LNDPHAAERASILAEARAWLGTPFHDDARLKGVGVDCAQLVAACYEMVRGPIETPRYSAQFFLHKDGERLIDHVERYGGVEIEESKAQPADLVLYKVGRAHAHAAIVVAWPDRASARIIHAHKLSGRVLDMGAFDADLSRSPSMRFFSLWP